MRRLFNRIRSLFTGPEPDPEIRVLRVRLDRLQAELEQIREARI